MFSYQINHLIIGEEESVILASPEFPVMREYAASLLPRLASIIETLDVSDRRHQGSLQCLTVWSSLAEKSLVSAIAKKLLQQLLVSTGAVDNSELNNKAAGWLSIVLAIAPYLSQQMVVLVYRTIRPLLAVGQSIPLQKRAYQVRLLLS